MYGINSGVIHKKCWVNRVNEKMCRSEKNQSHRGHRKVKCEISQALVMINLYVKFNVHSSYAKQIIVLKLADRRADGRTDGRTPKSILVQYFTSGVISEMWVDHVVQDILGGSTFWSPHIYEFRLYSCAIFYFGDDFWNVGWRGGTWYT